MSTPLQRYVALIATGGIALALGASVLGAVLDDARISQGHLIVAAILFAGSVLAVRVPFQIRHRTHVWLSDAAFLAMIFTLPWPWPGFLAVAAVVLGRVGLGRDLDETFFNAGQVGISVTIGALLFAGLADGAWLRVDVAGIAGPEAILVVAVEAYLLNSALVSVAAALQTGTDVWRLWLQNLRADLPTQLTIASLGVVAAIVAVVTPFALPLLVVPVAFVHRALHNVARLRTDTHDALAALVEVVELRDPYTAGHSLRVADLARTLALDLGLTLEEADAVASAGKVHDVGKVALDPRILGKTGPLEPGEVAQMRLHPVHGAAVVAHFAAYGDGHRLVRHHHERWDGRGYPDGLAGEAIPLGARILSVADAFDALTSARPYQAPRSATGALAILVEGAGRQWDARVVDALLAHADRGGIPLPPSQPVSSAGDQPATVPIPVAGADEATRSGA